jgi:hypothetical protein
MRQRSPERTLHRTAKPDNKSRRFARNYERAYAKAN